MENVSFKNRVRLEIIKYAKLYKQIYLDYEYLVCSEAFVKKAFYVIKAEEDNFQHLTGVHSLLGAKEFFCRAHDGVLCEDDFDFIKQGQSEKIVKGSVRRKMKAFSQMFLLFDQDILAEESFVKNSIHCSFATADESCTLGFVDVGKARPQTLLKGNELDMKKAKPVEIVFRKRVGEKCFDKVIFGTEEMVDKYRGKLGRKIELNINE